MAGIARELGQLIVKLMAAFPDARRDAKVTMAVYAEALDDIAIGSLEVAVNRAIREVKFFPAVAELREFADAHDQSKRQNRAPDAIIWCARLTVYNRAIAAGRKPYWPDIWGPLPTDHGCEAPDVLLAEFGIRRPLPPPQDARVVNILSAARNTLQSDQEGAA